MRERGTVWIDLAGKQRPGVVLGITEDHADPMLVEALLEVGHVTGSFPIVG